jgi:hypothetical protein
MAIWSAAVYGLNAQVVSDSTNCKGTTARALFLVLSLLEFFAFFLAVLTGFLGCLVICNPTAGTIGSILGNINNIIRGCASLASLAIIIGISALIWGSSCRTAEATFFDMANVLLIVYWSVAGSFFVCFCVSAAVASCANISAQDEGYMRA